MLIFFRLNNVCTVRPGTGTGKVRNSEIVINVKVIESRRGITKYCTVLYCIVLYCNFLMKNFSQLLRIGNVSDI